MFVSIYFPDNSQMMMRQTVVACLAALLVGFVSAGSVLDLGDSDFENKVAALDNILVMFYAPW